MKKILLFLVLCIALASCSSYQYNTTRVEKMDFTPFKTYAWLPPVDSLSKSYFDNDIAKANILDAANTALEAKGLQYSKDNPDLLFRYITIVNNKSRLVYGGGGYYGWGGPWGWYRPWFSPYYYGGGYYPVAKERYRYGHLIIEAIDRKTNAVIWQARGSGDVDNPEKAINNISKVAKGVIDLFPVKTIKK